MIRGSRPKVSLPGIGPLPGDEASNTQVPDPAIEVKLYFILLVI